MVAVQSLKRRISRASARLSALSVVAAAGLALPAAAAADTITFEHTGAAQTWTVPAGVTSAGFDIYGASGYEYGAPQFPGGKGGRATATLSVTPGEQIEVNVGGVGMLSSGGFNGGGGGFFAGGGASDIRIDGTSLTDRALVAGGGGGNGGCAASNNAAAGGHGGGLLGGDGSDGGCGGIYVAGTGGTQSAGGNFDGTLGQGGFGSPGGGGGGYYGGGGGPAGAGGGGSGFGPADTVFETGVRSGHGVATITYTPMAELTVSTSGSGLGYVTSPSGVDCQTGSQSRDACSKTVVIGESVTLTANADAGSSFTGWSGGACSDSAPVCTVVVDSAKTVDAAFAADPPPVPAPTPTPDPSPAPDPQPVITDLAVTPWVFAPSPPAMEARQRGAAVELTLSERASVRFHVRRFPARVSGRGGSDARMFTRGLPDGASSIPFTGTFQKTLKPGRYQVIATATDAAAQRSEKVRAKFRVIAG